MTTGGYADQRYLESLSEFGNPVRFSDSGAGWLVRNIEGTSYRDALASYPLLACLDWTKLKDELSAPTNWVSVAAVPDPLSAPSPAILSAIFPDVCRPFKTHWVVRLDGRYPGPHSQSHRRHLRRAERFVNVSRVTLEEKTLSVWCGLYGTLIARHRIEGLARFSKSSFARQFVLPGLRAYAATIESEVVSMSLWLTDGERAYYHLGAASDRGYQAGAPYAVFQAALEDLSDDGLREVLLGAGAGIEDNSEDGLSRFKRGWANESRQAYICGRILDRTAYAELCGNRESHFFPAYREPRIPTAHH